MSEFRIHPQLVWRPATGKQLSDYPLGTLCKDANGEVFLIGNACEGYNDDVGCGCCSDRLTWADIVEVATVCERV